MLIENECVCNYSLWFPGWHQPKSSKENVHVYIKKSAEINLWAKINKTKKISMKNRTCQYCRRWGNVLLVLKPKKPPEKKNRCNLGENTQKWLEYRVLVVVIIVIAVYFFRHRLQSVFVFLLCASFSDVRFLRCISKQYYLMYVVLQCGCVKINI